MIETEGDEPIEPLTQDDEQTPVGEVGARTEPQAESQAQVQAPQPLPELEAGEPIPELTAGDMETDLPAEGEPGASELELKALAEEPAEMEIPWGETSTLEPGPGGPAETEAAGAEEAGTREEQAPVESLVEPAEPRVFPHAWYVVHCYSGYENKVKKGLEQRIVSMGMHDRIFRVVVPVEKEVEIKEGQRRNIERRVFPGYILVEMMELHQGDPVSDEAWYVVRNTPGVTGFVSSGDKPVPLRQEEVDKILKRMETAEPKVHVTFRSGQTVHIIDGPFADFRGQVDNVDMVKGKVRVLVSFFGRETPVELDLLQVEKV